MEMLPNLLVPKLESLTLPMLRYLVPLQPQIPRAPYIDAGQGLVGGDFSAMNNVLEQYATTLFLPTWQPAWLIMMAVGAVWLISQYRQNRHDAPRRPRRNLWLNRLMRRTKMLPPFLNQKFKAKDGTITITVPYKMVEDEIELPAEQTKNTRHIERFVSDPSVLPFKMGFVYMVFEPDQNQNVDIAVSETLQMYSEFFPEARIDYKVAHLYEFEGVDGYMLMGAITASEEEELYHEFRHLYMLSENKFWNLNILYDASYKQAGALALQVFNSIQFDIELPYIDLDNIWEAEWNRFTVEDGIFSFDSPIELTALPVAPPTEGVLASGTYSADSLYNFNIHCGYQSTEAEDISVEETLEQLKEIYVRDYKLKATDFAEEPITEFGVPGKMVSGTITEFRTNWVFRGLIFALGNNVWFIQLRYQSSMEDGEAIYQRIRDSIRFDERALEDVINAWLDTKS